MSSSSRMTADLQKSAKGAADERRRHAREPYGSELHYGDEDLAPAVGVDLSIGGVSFVGRDVVPLGTEVEIAFLDRSVAVRGVVRSFTQVEDGFRLGVQFSADETDVVDVVRRYTN